MNGLVSLLGDVLEAAPDAVVVSDENGRIVYVNRHAVELFARAREELLELSIEDLLPERHRAAHVAHRAGYAAAPTTREMAATLELRALRGDGTEIPVEIALAPLRTAQGLLVTSAVRDARPRRAFEDKLTHLAAIIDAAEDAICSIAPDGQILTWNPGAERLFGYARDEMIGHHVSRLVPDGSADLSLIRDRVLRGERLPRYEAVRRRKNGSIVEVSVAVDPIFNAAGEHVASVAIARDITAENATRRRLEQSERLAALGTIAAGMGHEINNPLAVIVSSVGIAREMMARDDRSQLEDVAELLAEADEAADRIRRIVADLQRFARVDTATTTPLELRAVIDAAIRMTANVVRHHGKLVTHYGETPAILGDEVRLAQVFTNLLVNAGQALAGATAEKQITVTTYTDASGRAVAEIRDTGCGIAADFLPRIFEPFFTTKPPGSGTGLGLAISHNIIANLGGEITVESTEGHGSIFRVTLPSAAEMPAIAPAAHATPPRSIRGRVLVVDDEPAITRAFERVLRSEHEVTAVEGGPAALAHLASPPRYDVIFCDLMMPDVNGIDLYEWLRQHDPEQAARVVFVTGGAFTEATKRFLSTTHNLCLEKPISPHALRATARDFVLRGKISDGAASSRGRR